MQKNAVQKLQEIENDIKTVISLYEVANKSKNNNNDKPKATKKQNSLQFSKICPAKYLEDTQRFDEFEAGSGQTQASIFDAFKKTCGLISRPYERYNSREPVLGKKWYGNKPGSAPSSSSTLTTIRESDTRQQSDGDGGQEKGLLSKAKTSDNLKSSNFQFDPNAFPSYEVVMSPSKTIETANDILEKHNFKESEKQPFKLFEKVLSPQEMGIKDHPNALKQALQQRPLNRTSSRGLQKFMNSLVASVRSSHSPPKKTAALQKPNSSVSAESSRPVSPKNRKEHPTSAPTGSKTAINLTRVKSKEKSSDFHKDAEREVSRLGLQKHNKLSFLNASPKNNKDDHSTEGSYGNKADNTNFEEESVHPVNSKGSLLNQEESSVADPTFEEKNSSSTFVEGKEQFYGVNGDVKQETQNDCTEAWVDELSKVVEKSNQKLEKMKMSKELALDIAKHFKEKYDEVQKSKDELLAKLQETQKDKEKLTTEANGRPDGSNDKSHLERRREDTHTKMIKDENYYLKSKLYEVQAKYNTQLLENKNKIEEIEMERLLENRNGLKNREILERKIQLLTTEKNELYSKFEELKHQLYESQSKTRALEENIRHLEEEVIKQKQHLRIKTETLHGTNRELEMIRLNSTDLEEQVKTLRKNIEEFDGIQKSLIRQTTEYEQQIKANQEKIKSLQDENSRLKENLENEKDGVLIKAKIIEDQQQTIRQLKEKSEDAKTLLKRNQSLERVLNIEREEKLELQEAVQRLKWRKDELKKKVKSLENDVLLAPQEVVKDLQKTQKVLRELENQVQMKQREWELQLHTLFREKEQACSVAEFATKKLMETTNELQKQSDAYKGLQRIIAGNLAVKDRHHRETHKKAHDLKTL